jgi:hypothetical protein
MVDLRLTSARRNYLGLGYPPITPHYPPRFSWVISVDFIAHLWSGSHSAQLLGARWEATNGEGQSRCTFPIA